MLIRGIERCFNCCDCGTDFKTYALSVRDFDQVTHEVTIKHYRIHKLPDGQVFIARRCIFANLLVLVEHYQGRRPVSVQARIYVQARRLNFFETQINVMRNCVKRKNMTDRVHDI